MIKQVFVSLTMIVLVVCSCNSNQQKDSEQTALKENEKKADSNVIADNIDDDSKFVVKATSGVTMEVELGSYAAAHASTASVKQFGKTMAEEHSRDKQTLAKLAAQRNITIPSVPGADFQKHIDEITGKTGAAFDKAYISFMVDDHKKDISEFEEEAKNGKDSSIKAFAAQGISKLQHHLDMAKAINDQLK